jgi:tRNA(Ile)-lysidine synthase
LKGFLTQAESVKVELVRRSLAALGGGERDLTGGHYERVLNLAKENVSGRKIELPGGFAVLRDYEKLIFARSAKKIIGSDAQVREPIQLKVPGQTIFEGHLIEAAVLDAENCNIEKFKGTKTNFIEWFDLDKVKLPLAVRFRRAGDKFVPLGLSEEKKVGKFLTATKVPVEKRGKLLVVADGEKIIWVWPIRISEQAKFADTTRRILNLQLTY